MRIANKIAISVKVNLQFIKGILGSSEKNGICSFLSILPTYSYIFYAVIPNLFRDPLIGMEIVLVFNEVFDNARISIFHHQEIHSLS